MPRPEVLDDYYSRYYNGDGPKIAIGDVNGFANHLLRYIWVSADAKKVSILDFGGGDGTLGLTIAKRLLAEDPERTVAFTLVDYERPSAGSANRITVTHHRTLEEVEGSFDLVLASAVLEHIPDLESVIRRLFQLLAPGGWFYARTPYLAPMKRWVPNLDLTYPGHVHDLGAPFWNEVSKTYQTPLRVVVSQPSLIETNFFRQPLRTTAAWLMKLPARAELALSPARTPMWRWVGGWEVVLQKEPVANS